MKYDRIELEKLGLQAAENARHSAKRHNTWISYGRAGKVIREYPDGRKTEVIHGECGDIQEIEYTER